MKKFLLLIVMCVCTLSYAQEDASPEEREKYANYIFEVGEFSVSLNIYDELLKLNYSTPSLYYHKGLSHMELNDPIGALPYLIKAKELGFSEYLSHDLNLDPYNKNHYSFDLDFSLARSYHISQKFDLAILSYQAYTQNAAVSLQDKITANHYMSQAKVGLELSKIAKKVKISNVGSRINTKYDDYGALVFKDTSSIIFTRKQPNNNKKSINIDSTFKSDVFVSYKRKDGKWIESFRIGSNVNSDTKDDLASTLYSDDKKLIVLYDKGKIVEFNKVGTNWVKSPSSLKPNVLVKSMTVSDSVLIISSDFAGSKGGLDLFYALKNNEGEWSDLISVSDTLNTTFDESYPFLDPINNMLYFSSNCERSSGGFDVFKAAYNPLTKNWDKVENLGYPINTPRDDVYFSYLASSNVAFYNSNREDGFGGLDIYMVDYNYKGDEKGTLKLKVVTKDSLESPIKMPLKIIDDNSKEEFVFETNEKGELEIPILNGSNYKFLFKGDVTEHLDTIIVASGEINPLNVLLKLSTFEDGAKYRLSSVLFDKNLSEIRVESYKELDKFYVLLVDHPKLAIEIAGHTELGGLEGQNKTLSQARSNAVKEYLIKKGIDPKRMISTGYGSKYPIKRENTEDSKSLNRRTEVILHYIDSKNNTFKLFYK